MESQSFTTPEYKKHVAGIGSKIFGTVGILGGMVFCLTGVGIIVGIPAILGSLAIMNDAESLKGRCPYCSGDINAAAKLPGVNCPACKKRIVIRDKKFYTID